MRTTIICHENECNHNIGGSCHAMAITLRHDLSPTLGRVICSQADNEKPVKEKDDQ